ncbi:hypothetical protein JCM15765_45470 [Paradesulfitobacterium aromaticivorans]
MIPASYPLICGLDVHRGAISAALLDARGQTEPVLYTREFSAFTSGLHDLRQWLLDHDCPLVAMESCGIYWKPPFNVLAEANSAGKAKSAAIRRANRYLRSALVQVAWAAARQKDSPLANYFYAIKRRRGTNKALIALAHKLVRIIYALFTRQETFDFAKLVSSSVSSLPAPATEVKEEFPDVSELSEGLARIVDMAEEDDLPELPTSENHSTSPSPKAVLHPKEESPTPIEPLVRRRGRPRKKQTEG